MTGSDEQPTSAGTSPEPAGPSPGWSAGRVIAMVFASVGGLIGLALLLGGVAVIIAFAVGRDDDGYFTTDSERLESATYAITTQDIDLGADEIDWAPDEVLGEVRIRVDGGDTPLFVGIGPDEDVDRYIGRVARGELTDFDAEPPELTLREGRAPRAPPGKQRFWVAESRGSGEQTLTWDAEFGRWTAVVMNADAARGIDVEADAGIKLDWAIWAGLGMLLVGLLVGGGAAAAIALIARGAQQPSPPGG